MLISYTSRFKFSSYVVFIVFLVFSSLELKAQTIISPVFGSIDHPIPDDIFGFNGANTIRVSQSWNDILLNNDAETRLQELNARVLRYPGGTLGNYWDWRKGWFLSSHDFPNGIQLPENYNPKPPTNPIVSPDFDDRLETFIQCLSHSNAKPMWQMNVLTSDFNYQLATLYASKVAGVKSEYVELGNNHLQ